MKHLSLFVLLAMSGAVYSQKTLVYSDKVYESQIKTVQLNPDQNGRADSLNPSVAPIGQMNLLLEFDDLQANRNNYYAKIVHCNYDWTKSFLMDLDYLNDYNEFPLNDYALSYNTQVPYFHYRFAIPQVKVPGNYVVYIYRDGDKSDIILSKRFMVHMTQVSIVQDNQLSGAGTLKQNKQELNFTLDYSQIDIVNPVESMHVILRQNHRWDNAKIDVKPSFVRDSDRQLEFHFFDQDKLFDGGNEFRWVDFRSVTHPGQNTGVMNKKARPYQLDVQVDLPRTDQPYSQYNDDDGSYIIDNLDNGEPQTSGNYVQVTFTLRTPSPVSDPVYVIGAFNSWEQSEENLMKYDTDKAVYQASILLKQGLYNYQYQINSSSVTPNFFEGNHFETENVYEVLVYNHAFQPDADLLIGYFVIPVNPR